MKLFEQLNSDIKDAMKSHDNLKRDCLRTIVSDIKNLTVNAGKELTDDACIKALQKSVKMHQDSISQFQQANRADLLEKETAELQILQTYLPKMLSEESTQMLVLKLISDNKIEEKKQNMGLVMKLLKTSPEAKQIDMRYVSGYLSTLLK